MALPFHFSLSFSFFSFTKILNLNNLLPHQLQWLPANLQIGMIWPDFEQESKSILYSTLHMCNHWEYGCHYIVEIEFIQSG